MAQANRQNNSGGALVPIQQSLVKSEPEFTRLALAAKRGMSYHREYNFALSIIKENDLLQKCHTDSFVEAFENLGAMGLSLNRNLGHAALIPRWNTKRKCNWAVAMPMYRGYISLATGGSVIKNVWGAAVLDGDDIIIEQGSHPKLTHRPKMRKRNEGGVPGPDNMLGAYVIADINGSTHPHVTWVSIDDILSIAARSDSYNPKPKPEWKDGQKTGNMLPAKDPSGPWLTDFGQMAVKSGFRRAFKTWPGVDRPEYVALQEAVRVDTEAETIDHEDEKAIEGEAEEKKPAEDLMSKAEVSELEEMCTGKKLRPTRIAEAYGCKELGQLPAELYLEVKARINKAGSK